MPDLASLFQQLKSANASGVFTEALARSPLFAALLERHPLGFAVAKIAGADGTTLRLHLWPRGTMSSQPGYEIHNHAFDFTSYIIRGRFSQRTYNAAADESGDRAAYSVSYADGSSQLQKIPSRLRICLETVEEFSEFQTYTVSHDTLHLLTPAENQPGATLVLTHPAHFPAVSIGPYDGPDVLSFSRTATGRSAGEEYVSLFD